ncbi:MAG: WD40 repeat domain-containing protein [Anaerolineae bacterium]|nr:WD40 repeat domain-containing protein [Anaerolineae bacterium]
MEAAVEPLRALRTLNPACRDGAEWLTRHPPLGWRCSQPRVIQEFGGHSDGVTSVAFSPDGRLLASGSDDWKAKVWAPSG